MRTYRIVGVFLFSLLLALSVGCAKPTKEGHTESYKQIKDKLEALATKKPELKKGIDAKLAGFDKEFKEVSKKEGEDGVKALGKLVDRMKKFHAELAPKATAKPATKLDPKAKAAEAKAKEAAAKAKAAAAQIKPEVLKTAPNAALPVAPKGAKLGGTAPPTPKTAPPAPTGSKSGFGGK